MKKLLAVASTIALIVPTLALAASNDVLLTTDTVLSVNSITLNVSGSTASIESIEVGSTSFTAILQSGSSFKVSAPNLEKLTYDTIQTTGLPAQIDIVCTGTASTLTSSAIGSTTITITPSTTLCADAAAAATTGGSGGGSSGHSSPLKPTTPGTPSPRLTESQ